MSDAAVASVQDRIREAVARGERLRPVGGGTKSALAPAADDPARLPLDELQGVVEYEPAEYTVTVRAGTRVAALAELLAQEGQHLPFDPPFADAGATLGGTVAAGLSGPGRFRYGGVRDFLLGIRFVDGRGDPYTGGGRVVKNAAGFDLPKLMVGSLGCFGVLTELTFKVFPAPEEHATIRFDAASPRAAAELMQRLGRSRLDLACLEWEAPNHLLLRIGGSAEALAARVNRLEATLDGPAEIVRGDDDAAIWRAEAAFAWAPQDHVLVKVPVTPPRLLDIEGAVERAEGAQSMRVPRRYGVGGHVAWLAWPGGRSLEGLQKVLREQRLAGLVVRGAGFGPGARNPRLGPRTGGAFLQRIAGVLDPHGVLGPAPDERPDSPANRSDRAA